MRAFGWSAIALAAWSAAASAYAEDIQVSTAQPNRITLQTAAVWAHKPTAGEISEVWPQKASDAGWPGGQATLACQVMPNGKLNKCTVAQEQPGDVGLGEAAMKLAPLAQLQTQTIEGKVALPPTITLPISFRNPKFDTSAEWLRKPTFSELMANYPTEAMAKGVSGQAIIKCIVKTDGFLRACAIVSENKPGMGFGPAAIVLSRTFLMKPATRDGHPVESDMTIPINFKTDGALPAGTTITSTTVLGSAIWSKTPTVQEILSEIDKKVGDKFADGQVVFQCDLARSNGRMSNCIVTNASPGMVQFTSVAKSLVSKFQADPKALAEIKGSARINIAFGFPDMSSPAWNQRYLSHPQWTQTLSPEPGQPLFPDEAVKAGLKTGSATVDCMVAPNGSLTQCKTVSESTTGVGFGPMAERIAGAFVLNPWTDDGLPADGAHVKMPIRMVYDEKTGGVPASTH